VREGAVKYRALFYFLTLSISLHTRQANASADYLLQKIPTKYHPLKHARKAHFKGGATRATRGKGEARNAPRKATGTPRRQRQKSDQTDSRQTANKGRISRQNKAGFTACRTAL
jgi:hypothetical protein